MFEYMHRWLNDEKTILLFEISSDGWHKQDAEAVFTKQLEIIKAVDYQVNTIFHFLTAPKITPRSLVSHILKLMHMKADNEELTIFVGTTFLFDIMLNTVSKVYGVEEELEKYRFTTTVTEALWEIEKHKAAQQRSASEQN